MNQGRKDITRPSAGPRILVVEDDSNLALLLAYNLEAEGYVVECVERGDEAELRLAENPPDLVMLDWMLPGVSGLEICRRLRARRNTRRPEIEFCHTRWARSGEEGLSGSRRRRERRDRGGAQAHARQACRLFLRASAV
jgi:CheY-like chemotaxis protein